MHKVLVQSARPTNLNHPMNGAAVMSASTSIRIRKTKAELGVVACIASEHRQAPQSGVGLTQLCQ